MNQLKSLFISIYISLLVIVSAHSIYALMATSVQSAWLGITIATVPSLLFFIRLFVSPVARTSHNLNVLLVCAVMGSALALALARDEQELFYGYLYACGVGITGALLYIYWYSRFGRRPSAQLRVGEPLPRFTLHNAKGEAWCSTELALHPVLMLFYRGNWCPLCMAQIKEVAAMYRELEALGVQVCLISPQPEQHTEALAQKFEVNFQFLVDTDNVVAEQLGIAASNGTPKGLELLGYDSDTVMPTAIMTDRAGRIIFVDQTDNYRVRPEPETFLRVLEEHGVNAG